MAKKSSALASLGQFFSGGAGGVAQKLGSAVGRGVAGLYAGAGSAGSALGRGIAGLGTTSGRGAPLNQFTGQTRVVQGTPVPQQRYNPGPGRPTFGSGPGRPATYRRSPAGVYSGLTGTSGGTVGGGGLGGSMGGLKMSSSAIKGAMDEYYAEQKKANEANEARYQQLLGIADTTTGQRAKDLTADFGNQQSMAMQNLADLGLANTSGASTIRGGFGRKKNEALDRLADTMQQTKLGIIERRTDAAPDLGSYVALAQLLGTAGGGYGRSQDNAGASFMDRMKRGRGY